MDFRQVNGSCGWHVQSSSGTARASPTLATTKCSPTTSAVTAVDPVQKPTSLLLVESNQAARSAAFLDAPWAARVFLSCLVRCRLGDQDKIYW